jgi:hypothetical protein
MSSHRVELDMFCGGGGRGVLESSGHASDDVFIIEGISGERKRREEVLVTTRPSFKKSYIEERLAFDIPKQSFLLTYQK